MLDGLEATVKDQLRKLCWPILRFFETDEPAANYNPSHRTILVGVSVLFFILALVSALFAFYSGMAGALIPLLVFFAVGLVAMVVATLGSDSAVAKIWGNR